jgi:pyruvate dehydrogenase E2 component (dihydrolipoamide acetyltransferase)
MAEVVVMPKLGLTMREGAVARWLVEVGETVALGQPLCEIETDKITTEVEAPAAGVLLRRIAADEDVPVGVPIAVVGRPGEEAGVALHGEAGAGAPAMEAAPGPLGPAAARAAQPEAEAPPGPPAQAPEEAEAAPARGAVSPVARRLAAELGIDLATVRGSGPGGRIVRRDVEAAAGIEETGRGGEPAP